MMVNAPLSVDELHTALAALDAMSNMHVDIERCAEELRAAKPVESVRLLAALGSLRATREIVRACLDAARKRGRADDPANVRTGPRAA